MCNATITKAFDPIGGKILGSMGIGPLAKQDKPADAAASEAAKKKATDEGVSNTSNSPRLFIPDTGRIAPDTGLQIPPGR